MYTHKHYSGRGEKGPMVYFPLTRSQGDISWCPFYSQNKEQDKVDKVSNLEQTWAEPWQSLTLILSV